MLLHRITGKQMAYLVSMQGYVRMVSGRMTLDFAWACVNFFVPSRMKRWSQRPLSGQRNKLIKFCHRFAHAGFGQRGRQAVRLQIFAQCFCAQARLSCQRCDGTRPKL